MPLSIETYSLRKLIAHLLVVILILSKRYSCSCRNRVANLADPIFIEYHEHENAPDITARGIRSSALSTPKAGEKYYFFTSLRVLPKER